MLGLEGGADDYVSKPFSPQELILRVGAVLRRVQQAPPAGPEGTHYKVTLKFRHAGRDVHGRHSHFLGRFRLSLTSAADPKADPLPLKVRGRGPGPVEPVSARWVKKASSGIRPGTATISHPVVFRSLVEILLKLGISFEDSSVAMA